MWGKLLFNVQSEAFENEGCKSRSLCWLIHRVRWSVGWAAGLPGAVPRSWVCFYLPWHCRLAPSSICSFGTYLCNEYEQSLIKLQGTLPRNQCAGVYGDTFSFHVYGWVCVQLRRKVMLRYASLCMSFFIVSVFVHCFQSVLAYCQALGWCVCMCVADWCISQQYVWPTPVFRKPYC